jgi:hypothetical protein
MWSTLAHSICSDRFSVSWKLCDVLSPEHPACCRGITRNCASLAQARRELGCDRPGRYSLDTFTHGVVKGAPEVPQLLIEHGADVNRLHGSRATPWHLASSWGDTNAVLDQQLHSWPTAQLLIEHGIDLNAQDVNRSTPLHLVSLDGPPEMPRLLTEHSDQHTGWELQDALASGVVND